MGSFAHPLTFCEGIILERVRSIRELCATLEASQYARMVVSAEPEHKTDALARQACIESFAVATEGWIAPDLPNKAPFLDLLHGRLRELEALGIFVHQASIERDAPLDDGSEVTLTVAVIGIGNDPLPTRTIALPAQLRASAGDTGQVKPQGRARTPRRP